MAIPVSFTVFDCETTGLDPRKGDRIVEIAGVHIHDGQIHEEEVFDSLVNPNRPISAEALRVNRINEEELLSAPPIEEVLPKFLEFAEGTILVAHNAQFDMGFVEAEKESCWGYLETPECFCTRNLSRAVYPHEFRHNLDVIAQRFEFSAPPGRHRALPDVLLTAKILLKLLEEGNISSLEELQKKAAVVVAV